MKYRIERAIIYDVFVEPSRLTMSEEMIERFEALEAEIEQLDEFGPYTFDRVFDLASRCNSAGYTDHELREKLDTMLDKFPAQELHWLLNPTVRNKDKASLEIWQKTMGAWTPTVCQGNFDEAQLDMLSKYGHLPSFIENSFLTRRQRRAILDIIRGPRTDRDASPIRSKS